MATKREREEIRRAREAEEKLRREGFLPLPDEEELRKKRLRKLGEDIDRLVSRGDNSRQAAIKDYVLAGEKLLMAQEDCNHGEWLPYLQERKLHPRRAQRLQQLATYAHDLAALKESDVTTYFHRLEAKWAQLQGNVDDEPKPSAADKPKGTKPPKTEKQKILEAPWHYLTTEVDRLRCLADNAAVVKGKWAEMGGEGGLEQALTNAERAVAILRGAVSGDQLPEHPVDDPKRHPVAFLQALAAQVQNLRAGCRALTGADREKARDLVNDIEQAFIKIRQGK
jgi:hypothetical protein